MLPLAWTCTQPFPPMKESGLNTLLVCPATVGSSVRYTPPRLTGRGSRLYSSNQSSPLSGAAIHSLIRRFCTEPSAAGTELVAPGVGAERSRHVPPLLPT